MKLLSRIVIILTIIGLCWSLIIRDWFLSFVILSTIIQNLISKDWR